MRELAVALYCSGKSQGMEGREHWANDGRSNAVVAGGHYSRVTNERYEQDVSDDIMPLAFVKVLPSIRRGI